MEAYRRAIEKDKARMDAARARNADVVREKLEEETGMSTELDRAFELAFEAGRDTSAPGRIGMAGTADASKKRKRSDADDAAQCAVYVRGVPREVTFSRLEQHFVRCGDVRRVKIYKDAAGQPKGDALITFKKRQAAERAVKEIHGTDLFGYVLDVSAATFGGDHDTECGGSGGGDGGAGESAGRWSDGGPTCSDQIAAAVGRKQRDGGDHDMERLRVVVLSGLYSVEEVAASPNPPAFFRELEDDMWEGCARIGEIEAVKAFPGDQECCCAVRFRTARDAAECVRVMHGRYYNQRVIAAAHWDGNLRRSLPGGADEERVVRLGNGGGRAGAGGGGGGGGAGEGRPQPPPPPPAAVAPVGGAETAGAHSAPREGGSNGQCTAAGPATAAEGGGHGGALASDAGEAPCAAGGPAPPLQSAEELSRMSVRELRQALRDRGVDATGCVEKTDLVQRLLQ